MENQVILQYFIKRCDVKNYRSIFSTFIFCKKLKSIIADKNTHYLTSNNSLDSSNLSRKDQLFHN